MDCSNNFSGKFCAVFGPKMSRLQEVPDFQFPDYRRTRGLKHTNYRCWYR